LNLRVLLQTSLLVLSLLPTLVLAADRIGDFSLLDQNGYFHQMSWYDDNKAIVLLVQATGDTAVQNVLTDFDALNSRFDTQGIEFFMINPLGLKDRDAVKAQMAALNIDVPVLMDDARLISQALDIDKIGEVLVYNPKSFSLLFRGPLGAQLTAALTDIVAGRDLQTTQIASTGMPVSYPIKAAHLQQVPSYEKEIGPIIAQNCAACHREGGIAPFALDSHTMVMGWSQMIREVLMTKRMPPGQIDSHIGDFINDMVLADEDAQKIVHWIEAGSPKDGSTDPLTELVWPETEWAFGEPDYIVEIPEQSIPATGVLDYYNVMVELDLEEDRWVRASQYIPGDHTVLHHTLHSLIAPGETRGGSLLGGEPDRPDIAPYIPGQAPRMEPPNTGGLLKAGTRIAMQMHYTTTGKESVDASRIGLWFYPKGFVPEERMSGQCACHFTPTWVNIPPLDPDYEMTQSFTIEKDAKLFAFTPHMHFRGKRMRFYAEYPDGTSEELINIANYNYNWQLAYTYREPKSVPAGTIITATGAFDNSEQNKMNPDANRSVPWGLQSRDEMFFGAADWKYVDQSGN
jgi:mono/diheme cytochrome c family protein